MITGKFKYDTKTIQMELGYKIAHTTLMDLGLDVLSVLKENNTVIQTIMLDDSLMLKVWYYYVKEATGDSWEDALDALDKTPDGLETFKKAFWDMVVGFTSPSMQDALKKMWKEVQREIKERVEKNLSTLSSASLVEQE